MGIVSVAVPFGLLIIVTQTSSSDTSTSLYEHGHSCKSSVESVLHDL